MKSHDCEECRFGENNFRGFQVVEEWSSGSVQGAGDLFEVTALINHVEEYIHKIRSRITVDEFPLRIPIAMIMAREVFNPNRWGVKQDPKKGYMSTLPMVKYVRRLLGARTASAVLTFSLTSTKIPVTEEGFLFANEDVDALVNDDANLSAFAGTKVGWADAVIGVHCINSADIGLI
ncbi:hypothetical protein GOBAR_AA28099 [Gossypium barbadense]|uniref:Uncharacterized protein n=1 Tax=Gossypium barbadense TaxID=3634 RepID=A0A2P5WNB3_GOSBA|nr:hypothetical protein GOBAR_AA28099 [Gossypium barbadense]